MPSTRPIVILEDDIDDHEILKQVFAELHISNVLHFFTSATSCMDYLMTTLDKPFLILSDINLPSMSGLELKSYINKTDYLREKNIPFIFFSNSSDQKMINQAYSLFANGYFVKPLQVAEIKLAVKSIIDYWTISKRPDK